MRQLGRLRVLAGVRDDEFRHHGALRAPRPGKRWRHRRLLHGICPAMRRTSSTWKSSGAAKRSPSLMRDLGPPARRSGEATRRERRRNPRRTAPRCKSELRKLEIKRYGAAVIAAAPCQWRIETRPRSPAVALLMIAGSAVGLAISASSLTAVLTEKAATRCVWKRKRHPAPRIRAALTVSGQAGESADGFERWALSCVSKLNGFPPLRSATRGHPVSTSAPATTSKPRCQIKSSGAGSAHG